MKIAHSKIEVSNFQETAFLLTIERSFQHEIETMMLTQAIVLLNVMVLGGTAIVIIPI